MTLIDPDCPVAAGVPEEQLSTAEEPVLVSLSAVEEEPVLASDVPSGRKDTAAEAVLGPAELFSVEDEAEGRAFTLWPLVSNWSEEIRVNETEPYKIKM